jgi:RyR domain
MDRPNREAVLLAAARAAHEANRALCVSIGDDSQVPWEAVPEWQRQSCLTGVNGVLAGTTPKRLHETWLAEKIADGWKFGAVKDADKKEHPSMVSYHELPWQERAKDGLLIAVVLAMTTALGGLV